MSAGSIGSSLDTELGYKTQKFKVAVVQKGFERKMQTMQSISAFASSADPTKGINIIT